MGKKWKKLVALACVGVIVGFSAACEKVEPPVEEQTKTVEEVLASAAAEDLVCDRYDPDKYLAPYWESQIVYNESVIPYRDEQGNIAERSLTFDIAKVLEVRSNDLKILYEEGKDYAVTEDGKLSFPATTSIVVNDFDSIWPSEKTFSGFGSISHSGRYLQTGQNIVKMQIYVTYIRTDEYPKQLIPTYEADALANTIEKMQTKQDVSIVLYGDSISTGNASSAFFNMEPNAPIFSQMIQTRLRKLYGYDGITVHNCATGGWTAEDGRNNLTRVFSCSPDLVLLAFGMNDGGGPKTNAAKNNFYANYIYMIEKVWELFPKCDFLLVTSILPNPDALDAAGQPTLSNHKDFRTVAREICEEYGSAQIAVCDIMSTHEWILERKLFVDMGDGYNHPTDFIARLYAQSVCANLWSE